MRLMCFPTHTSSLDSPRKWTTYLFHCERFGIATRATRLHRNSDVGRIGYLGSWSRFFVSFSKLSTTVATSFDGKTTTSSLTRETTSKKLNSSIRYNSVNCIQLKLPRGEVRGNRVSGYPCLPELIFLEAPRPIKFRVCQSGRTQCTNFTTSVWNWGATGFRMTGVASAAFRQTLPMPLVLISEAPRSPLTCTLLIMIMNCPGQFRAHDRDLETEASLAIKREWPRRR